MARRLTLLALALLACAATARCARAPSSVYDLSDSESMDIFIPWDDYDSVETTRPPPRTRTTKISAKVFLKAKPPKVNVTTKNAKSESKKKIMKSTTINIQSHTNFIMTKKPGVIAAIKPNRLKVPPQTYVVVGDEYEGSEQGPYFVEVSRPSTRRPSTTKRVGTTKRPRPTTRRTTTSTSTSTQRPSTRSTLSTRRTTTKPKVKQQTRRTTACPTHNSGLLSNYFQGAKMKKTSNKPSKSGFFKKMYNWVSNSAMTWFRGKRSKKDPTTATTPPPRRTTAAPDWFQSLLESEENDDGAYAMTEPSKKPKKPLKKNYKGYQLLRAYPDMQWKVHELLDLQEEGLGSGLMWWTVPSMNGSTDLLVPPDLLADVKDLFKTNNIDFDVVIWDLQKAITYENPRLSKKQRLELEQLRGHPMTWRRYHRYADILRYLEYLQHSYADLVELIPLGRSSEGLPLVAVKISMPSNDTSGKEAKKSNKKKWQLRSRMKPGVWLDGGMHAQEWIAPAVATWMLHTLVEGEKGLGAEYEVLKQADFYILPVLNPDGYEHSHTHDRLWKKTRSRNSDSDNYFSGWFPWNWGRTECVGVDPDRNWNYHWGEQDASTDPCADNYAGPHPFSEPETRAVSEFLAEHRGQIKVYLSLHAYSQAWLLPSSHAHTPFADDGVLMEMGKLATAALADLYGTKYQVGTAPEIRQPASGMSHDWAKARAGIKYAYHVDLRDSYGPYGFLLPGSQIVSTARETWQAVKAIVDNIHD